MQLAALYLCKTDLVVEDFALDWNRGSGGGANTYIPDKQT